MNDRRDPKADSFAGPRLGAPPEAAATGSRKWPVLPSPSAWSGATVRKDEYDRLCAEMVAGGTFTG